MGSVVERPRVLIVDDDAITRKLFAMVVRELSLDVDVLEAVNVATAKAKVAAGRVKFVITDYRLADGSGGDVLAAVRSSEIPDAHVLAVTGLLGSDAEPLMQLGFDHLMFKPVDLERLRAYCRHAIAS